MMSLSLKKAQSCEDATQKKCKCRCNGLLHGKKRGSVLRLPFGDPHSLLKPCQHCKGRGKVYVFSNYPCNRCDGRGVVLPKKYREVV